MKYDLIIVRYGEIGLKAKETRRRFESSLVNNIKNALKTKSLSSRIRTERGRIYVYTDQIDKAISVLQKIFGITSISPAVQIKSNMDLMSKLSIKISKENLTEVKNFALRVTRTGEHSFTSQDVAIKLGSDIVKATKSSVNLTKPDFELFIEIRNENAYFFIEKIRGTGGLPLGTQGKVLAIIDKPPSILAAWYLMKRGCKTIFVNTDEANIDTLKAFTSSWFAKSDIKQLNLKSNNFYDDTSKLAIEKNCDAIITGHTLNDNPLENLSEIKLLKQHIKLPILFPLIAMKKDEINKKCKELGIQK